MPAKVLADKNIASLKSHKFPVKCEASVIYVKILNESICKSNNSINVYSRKELFSKPLILHHNFSINSVCLCTIFFFFSIEKEKKPKSGSNVNENYSG